SPGAGAGAAPRPAVRPGAAPGPSFIRGGRRGSAVTVKDRVGRTRYVVVRIDGGPLSRSGLGALLPPDAKLTRFDGTFGIVRTTHRAVDALLVHLRGVTSAGGKPVLITTLATSGTLRAAARRLPADSSAAARSTQGGFVRK